MERLLPCPPTLLPLLLLVLLLAAAMAAVRSAPVYRADYLVDGNQLVNMQYHMGPVVSGSPTNLYLIWYGRWDPAAQAVLRDFLASLSSPAAPSPSVSDWWARAPRLYADQTGANVTAAFAVAGEHSDSGYSHGTSLRRIDVQSIIRAAVVAYPDPLPLDPYSGAYLVLSSPDVQMEEFCRAMCGFHYFTFASVVGVTVPYAWVGNSGTQCPGRCAYPFAPATDYGGGSGGGGQVLRPPNGDPGVDGMVIVLGHELAELATNPLVNAWYAGDTPTAPTEIADLCLGVYGDGGGAGGFVGNVSRAADGSAYNVNGVNGRRFLVQWLWNPVLGKCYGANARSGFPIEVTASDLLMIYIKDGSTELALRWLRFMGSAGIRTNNFIIRQLFESCMKMGLYDSARPLLETYVGAAAKVDMILYTSILAHLVRCQDEGSEWAIMDILSVSRHKAHDFMCGLFTGPEQRKKPVLSFVREFFQGIDYDNEESAARYFVNVLLNYLVLMGQMNRARCVWKVAYENKLFPKAIVFDQHIAWSLDIRNLSVGAALVSTVHTLHRFRKRMLYYGVVPRRIKLVTGPTLKMVVAQVLASLESPFEVSKVVLRAPGDSVLEWFKKPIVQQFLLNEIPSKSDVLMHKLNVMFPSSAPEVRSLNLPRSLGMPR